MESYNYRQSIALVLHWAEERRLGGGGYICCKVSPISTGQGRKHTRYAVRVFFYQRDHLCTAVTHQLKEQNHLFFRVLGCLGRSYVVYLWVIIEMVTERNIFENTNNT